MAEDMTIGGITWHSSEEDGGPDVGISIYLGDNQRLWIGEITSQLFDQSGRGHFDSDGGWFLVWYKPEPVLIAKCADDLDARDFIEHIASRLRLSAQQREPVVRVKDILDRRIRLNGCRTDEPSIRQMIRDYYDNALGYDPEYAKSCAEAFFAAIEIIPAGASESSDAVAQGDCSTVFLGETAQGLTASEAHDGGSPGPSPLAVKQTSSDPASGRSQPSPDVSVEELADFIGQLDILSIFVNSDDETAEIARALLASYRIERLGCLPSGRRG